MLFAVALDVGLSPELLPGFVSVTLSAGARRMAQRGVILRHLEAVENLGSIDVLCTDKTGTPNTNVLAICTHVVRGPDEVAPDDEGRARLDAWLREQGSQGLRLLALATRTLQRLAALGIRIKIVTGDNRYVAAHVALEVGLDAGARLTGEQIDTMRGHHEGTP